MNGTPKYIAHWGMDMRQMLAPHWLALERMAQTFGRLLDPSSHRLEHGDGEPDGYDGIANRGPWERVLLSQWAMAESAPDEWLRRMADHEVSFLRLRRRRPTTPDWTLVIIDTGPDQLGAPRIAHMALLLALRSHARANNGSLSWAVLADPRRIVNQDFTRQSVAELLKARTIPPWSPEHIAGWRAILRDYRQNVWWVGSPELASHIEPDSPLVTIEEELYRGELHLAVRFRHAKLDTTRHVPVPDDKICHKLLRDPFERPRRERRCPSSGPAMPTVLIAASRNRVIVRESEQTLRSEHLPNLGNERRGRCHRFTMNRGDQIIAALRTRRSLLGLIHDERKQTIELWRPSTMLRSVKLQGEKIALPAPDDLGLALAFPQGADPYSQVWFVDESGTLWQLHWNDGKPRSGKILRGPELPRILAIRPNKTKPTFLTEQRLERGTSLLEEWYVPPQPTFDPVRLQQFPVGQLAYVAVGKSWLAATHQTPKGREVVVNLRTGIAERIPIEQGQVALGVFVTPSTQGIVILDEDGKSVRLIKQGHPPELLFEMLWPPAQITMTPDGTRIVILPHEGTLAAFNIVARDFLPLAE